MTFTRVIAAAALCAAVTAPLAAHHSAAMFDDEKVVELNGTIKEMQWTNPHSYVQVMVPRKDGKVEQWGIEIGAPAINVAMGWRKNSVKAGDKVKLDVAPARSGATYGTLRHLTFPDGRVLDGVAARIKAGPSSGIAG
jgi:hypothetical protein